MTRFLTNLNICVALFLSTKAFAALTVESTGTQGTRGALSFSTDCVTVTTSTSLFCANTSGLAKKADLWMPEMGHGSSPTRLSEAADGCTKIDEMDFFMAGKWEVRVTSSQNELFVFPINVCE